MGGRYRLDIRRYREFVLKNKLSSQEKELFKNLDKQEVLNDIIEAEINKLEEYFNSYARALHTKDYTSLMSIEKGIDFYIKEKFVFRDFSLKKIKTTFEEFKVENVPLDIKPSYYELWVEIFTGKFAERAYQPDSERIYLSDFLTQYIIHKGIIYLQCYKEKEPPKNLATMCGCCGTNVITKKYIGDVFLGKDINGNTVYYHARCVRKSDYLKEHVNELEYVILK